MILTTEKEYIVLKNNQGVTVLAFTADEAIIFAKELTNKAEELTHQS